MSLELPYNIKNINASANIDDLYGPYNSLDDALDAIPEGLRMKGKTFGVKTAKGIVEYWFRNGTQNADAVVKIKDIALKVNNAEITSSDGVFNITINSEKLPHDDTTSNLGTTNVKSAIEKLSSLIKGLANIQFKTVDELPTTGESNIIYLKKITGKTGNKREEYVWVDNAWELIGSTEVDLSSYAKLGNYTGTLETLKNTLETSISNKVDKVTGKQLSDENYSTAEKTKLSEIAAGAEVNVQADWAETDTTSDAYIKNKQKLRAFTDAYNVAESENEIQLAISNFILIGVFINGVLVPEYAISNTSTHVKWDRSKLGFNFTGDDIMTIKYLGYTNY